MRARMREDFGIQDGQIVYAYVGRFVDFKGFGLLARAFLRLAAEHPDVRLLLIGGRDCLHPTGLAQEEERALYHSPQVIQLGYREDVERCLVVADIMVFPSCREGMAVCLMESLALGVPAITCDARGCREVVRDNVDGLVLRERTVESVYLAMRWAALDTASRDRWRTGALEGRARFSRGKFVDEQIRCYGTAAPTRAREWRGKRAFDLLVTVPALILLAPVLAVVAGLVRFKLGSPVIFKQPRPGLHGKEFTIYKFRSMSNACGPTGELLPDAERLTRFGSFLRSSSLDELPELINILLGQMSIVGPRPLATEYLDLYSQEQAMRHHARPGLTGWAQINGRNAQSWERKFALDRWYVENQSIGLDLLIICRTAIAVLARRDISAKDHATMPYFVGSSQEGERQAAMEAEELAANIRLRWVGWRSVVKGSLRGDCAAYLSAAGGEGLTDPGVSVLARERNPAAGHDECGVR
jgi:lipopolysaccharide/colanic/teichoic acid biosynthesis glycosyltransferase